jgi:hypothetical protein
MKVEKVYHVLSRNGKAMGQFVTDMIYVQDKPYLVFMWEFLVTGQRVPSLHVAIDEKYLQPMLFGDANYRYELPVEDPRCLH